MSTGSQPDRTEATAPAEGQPNLMQMVGPGFEARCRELATQPQPSSAFPGMVAGNAFTSMVLDFLKAELLTVTKAEIVPHLDLEKQMHPQVAWLVSAIDAVESVLNGGTIPHIVTPPFPAPPTK
jgi:hypothetical protein